MYDGVNSPSASDSHSTGIITLCVQVNQNTANIEYAVTYHTTENVYILHNTKDTDISSADYWPEIGYNTINCPRCRKIIEHAQNLLKKGPTISGNDVTGICDDCKMKDKPCLKCQQVVSKFVPGKPDSLDINKERVKNWLIKIESLLQDTIKITDEKRRTRSDTHIDLMCQERQRSVPRVNVEYLFEPLELDLAVISQRHIDGRIKDLNNEKEPVAHFQQAKLKTPVVFKDPLIRILPSNSTLIKDDDGFGMKSNINDGKILKPALLREYNSPKSLQVKVNDTAKNDIKQANRIIFLHQPSKKLTKQKSSSEFIKDTKDKLDRAKEEKQLKEVFSKKSGQQSVEKETARRKSEKAIDYQKIAIDDNTNVRQEAKYSVKSNKNDAFRAQEDTRKDFQKPDLQAKADEAGYKSKKEAQKTNKYAEKALKHGYSKSENDVQKSPKDSSKPDKDGYNSEKSTQKAKKTEQYVFKPERVSKKTTKDVTKAIKDGYTSEKGAKKSTEDAQKAEVSYKSENRAQKAAKDSEKNALAERNALKFEKGAHNTLKDAQKSEKRGRNAEDLENQKSLQLNQTNLQKTQALDKKTKAELSSSKIEKKKGQEYKLKAEKEKVESHNNLKRELKSDARLGKKPILHDLVDMNSIKLINASTAADDLIMKIVNVNQPKGDGYRERKIPIEPITDMRLPVAKDSQVNKQHIMTLPQSESSLSLSDDSKIDEIKDLEIIEAIIGQKICKIRPVKLKDHSEVIPPLLHSFSGHDLAQIDEKQEIVQSPNETSRRPKTKKPETQETAFSTETPRTNEAIERIPHLSPGSVAAGSAKGFLRYALSDRKFIDNGWTLLPTEKVVRKMNVYRMRPAHPEFDWFEHNKNNRLMHYDTGEKLAEFDDNGRGRWFYRNGRMALDYYDAEELNAGQRFVIYSSGEPDERGRSRPYTLLATFDFAGNGIVFDHSGKIRLKYNQTEGVVLDRSIGPVSHWKWHTLNDPPVLQQVMIDTQIAHKDPEIMKYSSANERQPKKDNEDMLAIEFENFVKEKSKKLSQTFKPFQIKMKALKINEHFSLRVLDQASVYLLYRDGTTNLKLNIGMVLDQKEIVDTDTAEVGEVSNSLEKLPARTDSLAGLQRSVAHAQHYYWHRKERERKMRFADPSASVDKLVVGTSRPLRLPPRPVASQSTSLTAEQCKCSRKPSATNVYYDTGF